VIVSIHQPSTALFQTFDKLLILAEGKTCYSGAGSEAKSYFDRIGYEMPLQINPAEFILDLVNTDFTLDREGSDTRLVNIQKQWESSAEFSSIDSDIESGKGFTEGSDMQVEGLRQITLYSSVLTLLHRSFIKSFRDIIAYGVRIIMYFGKLAPLSPFPGSVRKPQILTHRVGLAVMVGTVWLRLGNEQENIQLFINALVSRVLAL
jgi:hypothetical protein